MCVPQPIFVGPMPPLFVCLFHHKTDKATKARLLVEIVTSKKGGGRKKARKKKLKFCRKGKSSKRRKISLRK